MVLLLIVFSLSGLLLAVLSVPLIMGKVEPNPWYGFRVAKTLSNHAVWYPVNAYAAKRLLLVGIGIIVSAMVLFFVPGIELVTYALACGGVALIGVLVATLQSVLYLRSFPDQP